jgi:hypothetical protein
VQMHYLNVYRGKISMMIIAAIPEPVKPREDSVNTASEA